MNREQALQDILDGLTPAKLYATVSALADQQPADRRVDVSLPTVMEALAPWLDSWQGADGWAARLRLQQAIIATVARTPELRYAEGDA